MFCFCNAITHVLAFCHKVQFISRNVRALCATVHSYVKSPVHGSLSQASSKRITRPPGLLTTSSRATTVASHRHSRNPTSSRSSRPHSPPPHQVSLTCVRLELRNACVRFTTVVRHISFSWSASVKLRVGHVRVRVYLRHNHL